MLTDRRDELSHLRVQTVNRLQRLLSELLPGQRKRDLSAAQAKTMLASVRPRDIAGKTRRRMAADLIGDLVTVDAKLKKIKAELSRSGRATRLPADGDPWGRSGRRMPGSWPTSATWPGSQTATGSRPGPGPHRWTPRPVSRPGTGCHALGTVG